MELIQSNINDGVCIITVNREKQMNALNSEVLDNLISKIKDTHYDRDVFGVIITGAGKRSFIAGADIKEMAAKNAQEAKDYSKLGHELTLQIENHEKPILAAVNGYALGGGCEMAMACHFRYASESALFGLPEVSLGLIPGFGGTQRLPRLIGRGRALELMLTGKMINAEEAKRIGLVNEVLPDDKLMDACLTTMQKILSNGPAALTSVIRAVSDGGGLPLHKALEIEADLFSKIFDTTDMKEGTMAFLEKRKPEFTGK